MKNQSIADKFSAIAQDYEKYAFIEHEIGQRLISKLQDIPITPKHILDLGCGTGLLATQLRALFPEAQVIGLDISLEMVKIATQKGVNSVCATALQLPFAKLQFDLVLTNCCIYQLPLPQVLVEVQRVLKVDGLLLCSSLGPDTFQELAMQNGNWLDMHLLGDLLLQQQFKDPIVEAERIIFNYTSNEALLEDLQGSGHEITNSPPPLHEPYALTVEAIYVLAWKTVQSQFRDNVGNTYINIDAISYIT